MWFFSPGTPTAQDRVVDEVRAKKITLVDEKGNDRAELAIVDGNPMLDLSDENGNLCVSLGVAEGSSGLVFVDENGKIRVGLAFTEGDPMLGLSD